MPWYHGDLPLSYNNQLKKNIVKTAAIPGALLTVAPGKDMAIAYRLMQDNAHFNEKVQ